nr:uncharacterized protein LOC107449508 isoform X4 [Parasteatoda tepidariorum]
MSTDKNNEVSVQRKEDALADKDKISSDTKSELNAKRSASELSGEEGKQKIQKTEHKSEYQVLLYCCFLMMIKKMENLKKSMMRMVKMTMM